VALRRISPPPPQGPPTSSLDPSLPGPLDSFLAQVSHRIARGMGVKRLDPGSGR